MSITFTLTITEGQQKSNIMKTYTLILLFLLTNLTAFCQPKLNSLPTATATIFLDFDGQTVRSTGWNSGNALICASSTMTSSQITDIFNRVSEDFRPFNLNITTDSTVFLAAPLNRRVRIIITPTSSWTSGVGGISYVGSFTWGDDTPGFVFQDKLQNNPKYIAECCSHESGHTLGLSHQSAYDANCNLVATYNEGVGTGEIGWAPIMGNSYYKNMTGWSAGPTPYGCNNTQDNLGVIVSQNGFSYRNDDYTEALNSTATNLSPSSFTLDGIISTNTDKDAFRMVINNTTTLHLEANPFPSSPADVAANLDIKVQVYNSSNVLINTYDRPTYLNVIIDTSLNAGVYYFVVSGTGNANTSNYGSLGSYRLYGYSSALPIHDVTLNGSAERGKHSLNWNIIADEPMRTQILEVSTDGSTFKQLSEVAPSSNIFNYVPHQTGMLYYRLKVTSVIDQSAYSNVIALKAEGNDSQISVTTLFQNDETVNSTYPYEYILMDVNGRILGKGHGNAGINRINMQPYSHGMYILQFFSNNERQTERIIKQ